MVVIDISDNGGGIPDRSREKVFDPFFTTKEVGKGTGQGLAIARSVVVDKHEGKLTFSVESGIGTTFHIVLPIKGPKHGWQATHPGRLLMLMRGGGWSVEGRKRDTQNDPIFVRC